MKLASFEAIVRALNEEGVPYLVVGGVAVNAHGYGRSTNAVDLVVKLDLGSVPFDFDAEYARASVQDIAPGVPLRIVALSALVKLKRDAARPQDLADLSELRLLHGDAVDA